MTDLLSEQITVVRARPAFEGANIRTWIGFKHFMYLAEAAVLEWLHERGTSARQLYLDNGLGLEIVDSSVQLPAVLELDDEVTTQVRHLGAGRLTITMTVCREGTDVTVFRAKTRVALVRQASAEAAAPAPAAVADLVVDSLDSATEARGARTQLDGRDVAAVLGTGQNSLLWSWRVPYFYCHYTDRVQHSGYVRALEEVVDRYLADRGISVGTLLRDRSWIPVVSRARVEMLAAAEMEEVIHTEFTIDQVLRDVMFSATMTCWVQRGDELIAVARAQILHGYAISAGPHAGSLAELDADIQRTLLGSPE